MVYDWEDKEVECYRMYVEEKKPLDEVMDYWKQRDFTPRFVVDFVLFQRSAVLYGCRLRHEAPGLTYQQ